MGPDARTPDNWRRGPMQSSDQIWRKNGWRSDFFWIKRCPSAKSVRSMPGPIASFPGAGMYVIRTNLGLGSISQVFNRVASSLTILHGHSISNPIRTQFSFDITGWSGKEFPRECLLYPELESYCRSETLQTIPPPGPLNHNVGIHLSIQCSSSPYSNSNTIAVLFKGKGENTQLVG